MKNKKIINLKNINIGGSYPIVFILGPCQIESLDHSLMIAEKISKICFELNDIYFLVVVLIGLFIFSSYIIRNPLTCPQKVCPKCNIIKIENPVISEENKIRRIR